MVGAKVCVALLQTPAMKIDAALAAVAAEDLPGGVGTPAQILDRNAALLKKDNAPASGQEIIDQIAVVLQTAVDATRDLAIKAGAVVLPDANAPTVPDGLPTSILLRRATFPHAATIQGHLVERMQRALIDAGHLSAVNDAGKRNDDGLFGQRTEEALKGWQTANEFSATGALTFGQWGKLTGEAAPDIYQRCAQLTAAFEGTNFGGVNKQDTDNTVVTFGYHGYTLAGGNLQKFLKKVDAEFAGVLDKVFGADKAAQLRSLFPPIKPAQAVGFGKAIFLSGINVKPDWLAAFRAFGEREEIKKAQLAFSEATYWVHAEKMREAMHLAEPLSHALCFDVAIQNGPRLPLARATFQKFTAAMNEPEKRRLFGEEIVQRAKRSFRKMFASARLTPWAMATAWCTVANIASLTGDLDWRMRPSRMSCKADTSRPRRTMSSLASGLPRTCLRSPDSLPANFSSKAQDTPSIISTLIRRAVCGRMSWNSRVC